MDPRGASLRLGAAHGGHRRVDRHVPSADDGDLAPDPIPVARGPRARQKLLRAAHATEITPLPRGRRVPHADAEEDRIELLSEPGRVGDAMTQLEFDLSRLAQRPRSVAGDRLVREPVERDRVAEHAPKARAFLEEGDRHARPAQFEGAGEAGRPGADHHDPTRAPLRTGFRRPLSPPR